MTGKVVRARVFRIAMSLGPEQMDASDNIILQAERSKSVL